MLNHDLTVKINVRDNIPLDQSDKPLWARIPFYFYFFWGKNASWTIISTQFEFSRQKIDYKLFDC